ncbi:hypothetical protein ABK040_006248 [Willaertia magna]
MLTNTINNTTTTTTSSNNNTTIDDDDDMILSNDVDTTSSSSDYQIKVQQIIKLPVNIEQIKSRFSHSSACYNNKIYIFGGAIDRGIYDNELYCYDIDLQKWYTIEAKGKKPLKRIFHTMVLDSNRDKLLIYGGRKEGGTKLNDFFEFDLIEEMWTKIDLNMNTNITSLNNSNDNILSALPKPTDGHSAVFCEDMNTMVVFGGHDGSNYIDSFTMYHTISKTWSKIIPENHDTITGRAYHTSQYSSKHKCLIISGGKIQGNVSTNQTFAYSFKTKRWTKLDMNYNDLNNNNSDNSDNTSNMDTLNNNFLKKTVPKVLCPCSVMISSDRMVIFGGEDSQQKCSDELWSFDFQTLKWSQIILSNLNNTNMEMTSIPKLSRLSMVFNNRNSSLYLFGGYNEGKRVNDFYQIKFETPPQIASIPIIRNIKTNTPFIEIERKEDFDNYYFDLILKCKKKLYGVHKCIILQCNYLKDLIENNNSNITNNINTIELPFDNHVDKLLEFLYGMEPSFTNIDEELNDLLNLSKLIQFQPLINWSLNKLQELNIINLDNKKIDNSHPAEYLQKYLANRRREIKENKIITDFKITIPNNDNIFYCDKTLLITRSDYFKSMLTHGFKEEHVNEVLMDQIDSIKQMDLILDHIYGIEISENTDLSIHDLMLLLMSSNFYCMRYLYHAVLRVLISNVNEENALDILINTSHVSNTTTIEKKLQNICLNSIRKKDLAEKLIEIASTASLLQSENQNLEMKLEELKKENELLKRQQ